MEVAFEDDVEEVVVDIAAVLFIEPSVMFLAIPEGWLSEET